MLPFDILFSVNTLDWDWSYNIQQALLESQYFKIGNDKGALLYDCGPDSGEMAVITHNHLERKLLTYWVNRK